MATIEKKLADTYQYVCLNDDAFDAGEQDDDGNPDEKRQEFTKLWGEAMASGDLSNLPIKAGQEPIVWTLKHLPSRHRRVIQDAITKFNAGRSAKDFQVGAMAKYVAARLGIKSAKGIYDGDKEWKIGKDHDPDLQAETVTHECMDFLSTISDSQGDPIGETLISEIGLRVIHGGIIQGKS